MLNCQYEQLFFQNCIDLKYFENEETYYKIFLKESLNDPKQMEYEIDNTYKKPVQYDIEKMIKYF
jgi:hypothetical protein